MNFLGSVFTALWTGEIPVSARDFAAMTIVFVVVTIVAAVMTLVFETATIVARL